MGAGVPCFPMRFELKSGANHVESMKRTFGFQLPTFFPELTEKVSTRRLRSVALPPTTV